MVSFQSEHYPEERRVEIVSNWDTSADCVAKIDARAHSPLVPLLKMLFRFLLAS